MTNDCSDCTAARGTSGSRVVRDSPSAPLSGLRGDLQACGWPAGAPSPGVIEFASCPKSGASSRVAPDFQRHTRLPGWADAALLDSAGAGPGAATPVRSPGTDACCRLPWTPWALGPGPGHGHAALAAAALARAHGGSASVVSHTGRQEGPTPPRPVRSSPVGCHVHRDPSLTPRTQHGEPVRLLPQRPSLLSVATLITVTPDSLFT